MLKKIYLAKVDEKFLLKIILNLLFNLMAKQKNYNSKKDTTESMY